jgi:hypothetical protein
LTKLATPFRCVIQLLEDARTLSGERIKLRNGDPDFAAARAGAASCHVGQQPCAQLRGAVPLSHNAF